MVSKCDIETKDGEQSCLAWFNYSKKNKSLHWTGWLMVAPPSCFYGRLGSPSSPVERALPSALPPSFE